MTQLRLLKLGAILLLLLAILMITLIVTGAFDPKAIGALVWQSSLPTMSVPANSQQIEWLDKPIPQQSFSVRLTAVFIEGDLDSGYGLALGNEDDSLIVAVSPLGYATIQQDSQTLFPWQPWPHVNSNNTPNEIWLDLGDGHLTVRLNRELMWVGTVEMPEGNLGLYGESFAETAVFDFTEIELYNEK